ncbi:hypothetical protein WICPIJ_004619, partial [Wickerhamomyces pijperi]
MTWNSLTLLKVLGLYYLASIHLFLHATAATIAATDVFTSLSVQSQGTALIASGAYQATLTFDIKPSMAGDNFILTMPDVYSINTDLKTITVTNPDDSSQVLLTCDTIDGAYIVNFSELQCTVGDNISTEYTGSLNFVFTFSVGGSASDLELEQAIKMTAGPFEINWDGLTSNVTLPGVDSEPSYDSVYSYIHSTKYGTLEEYYLLPSCEGESTNGDFTITFNGGAANSIDCDSVTVGVAGIFNSWYLPEENNENEAVGFTCDASTSTIYYTIYILDPGYRPYLTVFQYLESSSVASTNKFVTSLTCGSSVAFTNTENYQIVLESLPNDETASPLAVST